MNIADKIKYLRTVILSISQDDFGAKLNVTRNTIKNWESGVSQPTVSHIILISMLCDVTIDYLIFDDHPYELSLNGIDKYDYAILQALIKYLSNKGELL